MQKERIKKQHTMKIIENFFSGIRLQKPFFEKVWKKIFE